MSPAPGDGSARRRSVLPFVIAGLAVCLLIGMFVANFAASTPDAQQRAVIESVCEGASDKEACLSEQEGEPVFGIQPPALFDYGVTWISGLVGVLATFALGAGIMLVARSNASPESPGRRAR